MRKKLDRVTLILVDCTRYGEAISSLQKSLEQIEPARTIFFTDNEIKMDLEGVEIIKIPAVTSKLQYSYFIVKQLWEYIETDFVLITQWDAWVLNGDSWDDEFYNYDYLGSPWLYIDGRNCGNGGFSLRSTKLQSIIAKDGLIQIYHPEDEVICRLYRYYLQVRYGIKFPTDALADTFSFELRAPICKTFGFHGKFHEPFKPIIMLSRKGAFGDVLDLEPLMFYYHTKGYRIILNTDDKFFAFFSRHYFKIYAPGELDSRIPIKEIDLNMAYEVYPKQLHLKSYYDICGIPEEQRIYRTTNIGVPYDLKQHKLFNRYVVIHNDIRDEASRNIEGIDWETVVDYLNQNGYDVIQIGTGRHKEIPNATFMNTLSESLLIGVVGSADCFIGIDSAPSHVAVALETPAIILSGSVDLRYIHPDMSGITWMHNHDKKVCEKPFCWHDSNGCTGTKCYISTDFPPCNVFDTNELLEKINAVLHVV